MKPTVPTVPTPDFVARAVRAAQRLRRRVRRQIYRRVLRHGHGAVCPICGWEGSRFLPSKRTKPNRICPGCGSTERYRALELWLRRRGPAPGSALLEIAPIELVRATARDLGYRYASVDLHSPRALVLSDLCHSPFRDGSFDVIVCFHVLEHIIDDGAAMAEMARTLSPGGMALVVVPRDAARGPTFEGASADPSDNERLYGQSDHVRIYGDDVTARLERAGLGVDEVEWSSIFSAQEIERYRLAGDDDRFWICQRS